MSNEGSTTTISLDKLARLKAAMAIVVGGGLVAYELVSGGEPIFLLAPIWVLILGGCLVAYGVLQFLVMAVVRWRIRLSDSELRRYGKDLEEATPLILDLLGKGMPPGEVAGALEVSRGVPVTVTLKYIIALGRYTGERNRKR